MTKNSTNMIIAKQALTAILQQRKGGGRPPSAISIICIGAQNGKAAISFSPNPGDFSGGGSCLPVNYRLIVDRGRVTERPEELIK